MISEKRPPDAGGVPGPAVGVCLTGSFPEDHLISTGPVGLPRRGKGSCWPPLPTTTCPLQRPSLAFPILATFVGLGGVEAAAQSGSGCGSEGCLLEGCQGTPTQDWVPGPLRFS